MELFLSSLKYITSDNFFWGSMAMVSIIGAFIGAVIYDGVLREVKKTIVVILAYAFLIITVTLERVIPQLDRITPESLYMPFAGIETILIITLFYILGMLLGVFLTKKAHKGEKKNEKNMYPSRSR